MYYKDIKIVRRYGTYYQFYMDITKWITTVIILQFYGFPSKGRFSGKILLGDN